MLLLRDEVAIKGIHPGFCPTCATVMVIVLGVVFILFITAAWYGEGRGDDPQSSRQHLKGVLYVLGSYGWFVGVPLVVWLIFFR